MRENDYLRGYYEAIKGIIGNLNAKAYWVKNMTTNSTTLEERCVKRLGLTMVRVEREILDFIRAEIKNALTCNKELPDGSICKVTLDCHLHDWRQKEFARALLDSLLQDSPKKLKDAPYEANESDVRNATIDEFISLLEAKRESL